MNSSTKERLKRIAWGIAGDGTDRMVYHVTLIFLVGFVAFLTVFMLSQAGAPKEDAKTIQLLFEAMVYVLLFNAFGKPVLSEAVRYYREVHQ
jgi:hypothetical protein